MVNMFKLMDQLRGKMDEDAAHLILSTIFAVYEDLQNMVTKAEFNELKDVVKELAQAQQRTEQRVEELVQTQKELANNMIVLIDKHQKTREQVGGLSHTVGYVLEDRAYKALPKLLARDHGIHIEGYIIRKYITDPRGKPQEINIFGEGTQNGKPVVIIGEGKSQLHKKHVNTFLKETLPLMKPLFEKIIPVLVTYQVITPQVEDFAKKCGILLYYSYQFDQVE